MQLKMAPNIEPNPGSLFRTQGGDPLAVSEHNSVVEAAQRLSTQNKICEAPIMLHMQRLCYKSQTLMQTFGKMPRGICSAE